MGFLFEIKDIQQSFRKRMDSDRLKRNSISSFRTLYKINLCFFLYAVNIKLNSFRNIFSCNSEVTIEIAFTPQFD